MRAKREMNEGLRLLRRERVRASALMRAFDSAINGTPEQREEYEKEVVQVAAKEAFHYESAKHNPPPSTKSVRSRMSPNWSWWKGKE